VRALVGLADRESCAMGRPAGSVLSNGVNADDIDPADTDNKGGSVALIEPTTRGGRRSGSSGEIVDCTLRPRAGFAGAGSPN